jgi:hypothetical protein
MYIDKTTAGERLIIEGAMFGVMAHTARARRLLTEALGEYFEDAEQKAISPVNAEYIRDILFCVSDLLWDADIEHCLTVGDDSATGLDSYFEGCKRGQLVRKVEALRRKLDSSQTKDLLDMDDEQALPLLEALAKGAG